MAAVVLHLVAADGAPFDLTVTLPPVRTGLAAVRVASVRAFSIQTTNVRTSGQWVTQP
jgi:hypothetical protein